ncbi:hypothetical protein [Tahibacter caeni]|uniref:hypothetical protein n=1 Tax=Tahibacter caeni TaxID=1453545 RepID=UPI0021474FD7|nr:hypothetical protein [Tahibacter caeni]
MSFLLRGRYALAALVLLLAAPLCQAQVPVCDALTLYGNAANSGLCRSLSPTTQNLWVCELSGVNPDVHTTFNAVTALHVTVRTDVNPPSCQGNSILAGNWPPAGGAGLTIAPGQPAQVCNVNINNWVARLNAVPQVPAGGATACRAGFLAALAAGRLSNAVAQTYLNTCNAQACP